jgi:hypothetical protein
MKLIEYDLPFKVKCNICYGHNFIWVRNGPYRDKVACSSKECLFGFVVLEELEIEQPKHKVRRAIDEIKR